jgi:carboxylate-amine ligase
MGAPVVVTFFLDTGTQHHLGQPGHSGGVRTVGVEEEFLVVDAHLDDSRPTAAEVLQLATPLVGTAPDELGSLVAELKQQQVEANTSPHDTMDSLQAELVSWRAKASSAAHGAGALLMASGTSPVPVVPLAVHSERYDRMTQQFGIMAREHLTCGCHVHVAVDSDEEGVAVLDRIRIWLPLLLALSANSPLWQGADSDYASYRSQVMGRWPASGPYDAFGSAEGYRTAITRMVETGVLLDEGMVYFDARCSAHHPTVEIRVADVCLDVGDTVLVAALSRALVETAARQWAAGVPAPDVSTQLLRMASWQAARWGTRGALIDPLTFKPATAHDVVTTLVDHVRPALRWAGDEALVENRVERLFALGNGAVRQRDVFHGSGINAVVDMLVRATVAAP